jgi:broad specificity phosphatase PhoE
MARVYMIRHGKPASTWGEPVSDPDPGLDVQGRDQAQRVCAALLALPPGERPTAVATSPLRRCRETAAPFAGALNLEVLIEHAVAEIPTPSTLSQTERGPWLRGAFDGTWTAIEGEIDYAQWRDRVGDAVALHPGFAIFSHFVAINAAVSAATGEQRVRHFPPDHGSITVFDIVDGKLTLIELGRSAETQVL